MTFRALKSQIIIIRHLFFIPFEKKNSIRNNSRTRMLLLLAALSIEEYGASAIPATFLVPR